MRRLVVLCGIGLVAGLAACGGHQAGPAAGAPVPAQAMLAELQAVLARELAARGSDPEKTAAAPPAGPENVAFDLTAQLIDPDGPGGTPALAFELRWTDRLQGDYDQNGEVNAGDLVPLAQRFKAVVHYDAPELHGGFAAWPAGDPVADGAANWRAARVDGNSDGEIGLADVTTIAQHWHQRSAGYLIERALNRGTGELEWEPLPLDLGHGSWPSAPRPTAQPGLALRYSVSVPFGEPAYAQRLRVRAWDSASATGGEASAAVDVYPDSAAGDTTPPVWLDGSGVQRLVPAAGSIRVEFGTAVDGQSPPVGYTVFWAPGDPGQPDAPFDYGGAASAATSGSPYTIQGLTVGAYYRVAVRASDSAVPPNMEVNSVLRGALAAAQDIYPPQWTGQPGIAEVHYGQGQALLALHPAEDSTTDAYGTWSSGPVVYVVQHGPGLIPGTDPPQVAEFPAQDGGGPQAVQLAGLDTTQDHWFAVALRDSAPLRNTGPLSAAASAAGFVQTDYPLPVFPAGVPQATTPYTGDLLVSPNGQHAMLLRRHDTDDNTGIYLAWYRLAGGAPELVKTRFFPRPGEITQSDGVFLDNNGVLHAGVVTRFSLGNGGSTLRDINLATEEFTEYELEGNGRMIYRPAGQPLFFYSYINWDGFNAQDFEFRIYDPEVPVDVVLKSGFGDDELLASTEYIYPDYCIDDTGAFILSLHDGKVLEYANGGVTRLDLPEPAWPRPFIRGNYVPDYFMVDFGDSRLARANWHSPPAEYSFAPAAAFEPAQASIYPYCGGFGDFLTTLSYQSPASLAAAPTCKYNVLVRQRQLTREARLVGTTQQLGDTTFGLSGAIRLGGSVYAAEYYRTHFNGDYPIEVTLVRIAEN